MKLSDLHISAQQQEQFEKLVTSFLEWNEKMNLSSFSTREEVLIKHILDSILGIQLIDSVGKKIADLGSGGGFPALPLAILAPESEITAIDSVGKKMKAVAEMASECGILNLSTASDRLETLGQNPKYREQFDLVTARALAPWPVLLELALPFVKVGGLFIAWQTPAIEEDLKFFRRVPEKLGGEIIKTVPYSLPNRAGERVLVFVKKRFHTQKAYPRAIGLPKNRPLGS